MTYILSFFLIYLVSVLLVYLSQRRLVYFPTHKLVATPEDAGLSFENIEIKASDGIKIHGWFIPNGTSKDVLLFCHGTGGNMSHRIDLIDLYFEAKLNIFIFDYRGYGNSGGKPGEKGTYRDVNAAWKFLTEKKNFKPENIIILGRSIGGGVATYIAVKNRPKALILDSTFTSIPDIAKRLIPIFPTSLFPIYQYPNLKRLKMIRCPILIFHSSEDSLIPFSMGKKLFSQANDPKMFIELKGTHDESYLVSEDKYRKGVEDFLKIL